MNQWSAGPLRIAADNYIVQLYGVERVTSVGSIWTFDRIVGRYMRLPNREAPRERAEWSDERAGTCRDAVWHPLLDWWFDDDGRRLLIRPGDDRTFWAPMVPDVMESRFDVWDSVSRRAEELAAES